MNTSKLLFPFFLSFAFVSMSHVGCNNVEENHNVTDICDPEFYSYYFQIDRASWLSSFIISKQPAGIDLNSIDYWVEGLKINDKVYVKLELKIYDLDGSYLEDQYYAFDCNGNQLLTNKNIDVFHEDLDRLFNINSSDPEYHLWVYYPDCCPFNFH